MVIDNGVDNGNDSSNAMVWNEPAVVEQRVSLTVTCLQQDNVWHRGSVRAIQLLDCLITMLFSFALVEIVRRMEWVPARTSSIREMTVF